MRFLIPAIVLLLAGSGLAIYSYFVGVEAWELGIAPLELEGPIEVKWQAGTEFRFIVETQEGLVSVRVDDVAWFSHEIGDRYAWTSAEPGPGQAQLAVSVLLLGIAVAILYAGGGLLAWGAGLTRRRRSET